MPSVGLNPISRLRTKIFPVGSRIYGLLQSTCQQPHILVPPRRRNTLRRRRPRRRERRRRAIKTSLVRVQIHCLKRPYQMSHNVAICFLQKTIQKTINHLEKFKIKKRPPLAKWSKFTRYK
ncbi:MAG: hypothetical protein [Cressdnaviricota sp.]|nr:MAG: hypothetical protein [Cressdnaviricota sp.]